MLIFDAHLDLAMNAIEWNRDLTRPLAEIRQREAHLTDKPDRGHGTVSLPELRRAGIRLVVATLIARVEHNAFSPVHGWASPAQAYGMTQAQNAWYRMLEEAGEMVRLTGRAAFDQFLHGLSASPASPATGAAPEPIGYILSLEGADSILSPAHLERAWADGLRAIGPAHYGPGIYANGTDATGGFNARGRELLREMDRLGFILDATHLCDDCFWEAMDWYHGPVWASHHNCRALVPHNRQLSDDMIRALVARGAVIGMPLDAWMIVPGWIRRKTTPASAGVLLTHALDHLDHICQLAGNARHVGIGSDLDGAFGTEQTPQGVETIADLARVPGMLVDRGFSAADARDVAHGNFVRFVQSAWKA